MTCAPDAFNADSLRVRRGPHRARAGCVVRGVLADRRDRLTRGSRSAAVADSHVPSSTRRRPFDELTTVDAGPTISGARARPLAVLAVRTRAARPRSRQRRGDEPATRTAPTISPQSAGERHPSPVASRAQRVARGAARATATSSTDPAATAKTLTRAGSRRDRGDGRRRTPAREPRRPAAERRCVRGRASRLPSRARRRRARPGRIPPPEWRDLLRVIAPAPSASSIRPAPHAATAGHDGAARAKPPWAPASSSWCCRGCPSSAASVVPVRPCGSDSSSGSASAASPTPRSTIALARCRKWSKVFSARMFSAVPTRKNPTIPSSR